MSDTWGEFASFQRYVRSLIEPMTQKMKSVVEAEGCSGLLIKEVTF